MTLAQITRTIDGALRTRLIRRGLKVDRIHNIHISAALVLLTGGVICVEVLSLRGARADVIRQSLPDASSGLVSLCLTALFWIWTRKTGSHTLALLAYALFWACGLSLAAAACLSALLKGG